jgi:hypothetical protein
MSKRFLALVKADIPNRIDLNDNLITAHSDIVYGDGMIYSGEIVVSGFIHTDTDEDTLGTVLVDYLKQHTENVNVIKVEFREDRSRVKNEYRRAG